ncbi:hypothetical protein E4U55_007583 [Claviceps digitariae]|nr:hypothetical protein E4U55_007583 [Claviceps digitariae]
MKFSSILLACLPAAMATSLAYKPPRELLDMAKHHPERCVLPGTFHIKNFHANAPLNVTISTNGTHSANSTHSAALTAYKFTYVNTAKNITTMCSYHPGSIPQGLGGGEIVQRYACKDLDVSFVWTREKSRLTLIQKVCPDPTGHSEYAAFGSVFIPVSCVHGKCDVRKSDFKGRFTKLRPLKHLDVIRRKHRRGIALAYDGYN